MQKKTHGLIRIEPPRNPGPFHWSRKFFHMLGLLIPILFYADIFRGLGNWPDATRSIGVLLLLGGAALVIFIDLLRFRWKGLNRLFLSLFGSLMKEDEADRFNAVTPYLISCGILLLFCAREVVALSCIFLMLGDPAAAYVGSRFGRIRFWNNKSLEGMLAFVFVGFLGGLFFLGIHTYLEPESFFALVRSEGAFHFRLLLVVFLGAVFAAIAEFFSSIHLRGLWDDNLLVPLGAVLGLCLGAMLLFPGETANFWFHPGLLFQGRP